MSDLARIQTSGILQPDVIDKIMEIEKDIELGFARRQRFRPRFLMEVSVLNDMKFPTPDAKYWQCNLERDVHFRNLVMASFDYREKEADIKILEAERDSLEQDSVSGSAPELKRAQVCKKNVQIDRENASLIYMEKEAMERAREILTWTDLMVSLEPDLKYSVEDIEEHMPEAYTRRFARETEAMKIAGDCNVPDLAGAMNIIALSKTISSHEAVNQLIAEEQQTLNSP